MKKQLKQRLNDLYERTIDNGYELSNKLDFDNLDFYNLYSNAVQSNCAITLDAKDNLFFLNHKYNNQKGLLMIYMINNLDTNKKLSEKIMNIVSVLEDIFISLDDTIIKNENSATYLIIYKNLTRNSIGGIELCQ